MATCALGDGAALPDPTAKALQNEVWRGPINTIAPDVDNPTWLVIEAHVPPQDGGFTIREFGIYTDDGILFAIGNHPETYKPTLAEGTGIDLVVRPICAVSNATSVTLLTDPAIVMASKKYVDDTVAMSAAHILASFTSFVSGMILMWSGKADAVPDGWALCDGKNGTPNLLDRFVVGAGDRYAPGTTGGLVSTSTSAAGAHAHNASIGMTTLTEWHMPSHFHSMTAGGYSSRDNWPGGWNGTGKSPTDYTGGNGGHNHAATVSATGDHTHTVATLPPYYALCFIVKL